MLLPHEIGDIELRSLNLEGAGHEGVRLGGVVLHKGPYVLTVVMVVVVNKRWGGGLSWGWGCCPTFLAALMRKVSSSILVPQPAALAWNLPSRLVFIVPVTMLNWPIADTISLS